MKTHHLKIALKYYKKIQNGIKNYEIRYNDRDYQNGDRLVLKAYDREKEEYLDYFSPIKIRVNSILKNYAGLKDNWVILNFTAPDKQKLFDEIVDLKNELNLLKQNKKGE